MPITKASGQAVAPAAKGDLVVGSATNDAAVLGVGSTNQVLTVDSSTATGLKWATAGNTFAGASIYNSTNVSLANNTDVSISCGDETFDTDGYHSTSTNTSRITVPSGKAGYYILTATANFSSNATGYRNAAILKNGAAQSTTRVSAVNGAQMFVDVTAIVYGAVGDYFELQQYQNSGSTLTASYSNFSAAYIGA